jgi:hypothetical protein
VSLAFALLVAATPPPASPWTKLAESNGVVVEKRRLGGGTLVRGRTELPHSASEVAAILRDLEGFAHWIPSLSTWKVIEKSETEAIVYARHNLAWPMDDRDYCVRYTWKEAPSGGYTLRAKATKDRAPPPEDGVIRLEHVQSEWVVAPSGTDRSSVTYTYYGELGGSIPQSIETEAWKREPPKVFEALTKEIDRRATSSARRPRR